MGSRAAAARSPMGTLGTSSRSITFCALLAACSSAPGAVQESLVYFDQGNYYQAYQVLDEARNPNDPDQALEREYWRARLFYLLDRGQELIFLDRDAEGMEELQRALALDPGNKIALKWIAKAKEKLADAATRRGDELRSDGDLEKALESYQEAIRYVPGHPGALAGRELVEQAFEKNTQRAKAEHMEGVRKMHDRRYSEVWRHETNALAQDPGYEEARELQARVLLLLAEQIFEHAKSIEDSRRFGAALLEYMRVQRLAPDYPGLQEHIDHMANEVKAEEKVRRADMAMRKALYEPDEERRRAQFAEVNELLREAFDLSISAQATISELMVVAREKESEARYYAAKDLELQFRYEAALEAFRAIDADWPDGFMDVKARINDLDETIGLAEQAFAEGQESEKAGNISGAIEAYRRALLYYPTYKGLEEKIKTLTIKT